MCGPNSSRICVTRQWLTTLWSVFFSKFNADVNKLLIRKYTVCCSSKSNLPSDSQHLCQLTLWQGALCFPGWGFPALYSYLQHGIQQHYLHCKGSTIQIIPYTLFPKHSTPCLNHDHLAMCELTHKALQHATVSFI